VAVSPAPDRPGAIVNVIALDLFDLFWSMLWFFLFVMWIFLFVTLITDIFRSHDLSGWGKAAWIVGLLVFPILGSIIYVIVRGDGMAERHMAQVKQQNAALQDYVRNVAGTTASPADEVAKLVDLRASGVITDEEFERQKAKILA
jgi:hypothetical protein